MLSAFGQFATSSGGLGALGLNVSSFVVQLITFIIALLVLKRWAFKPILKIMKERQETIEKGVKLGEEMKKERQELAQKVTEEISKARQKADTILTEATEEAKEATRKAETEALNKADLAA